MEIVFAILLTCGLHAIRGDAEVQPVKGEYNMRACRSFPNHY
jgi:hypothetical protein